MRQEADGIRRYCHVGTGNYNPKTAAPLRGHRAAVGRPRPRRRPHRPVQPPHRLQPPGRRTGSCWSRPSHLRHAIADRIEQQAELGAGGPHHAEDEQPGRPRDHRRAVRRVAARHRDRPHRARHLLPATAGARAVGQHPGAVDRRPVPRALPGLPLRRRPRNRRVPHRVGRPHAPQPRPSGRGARARHRPAAAGAAGGDARARPRRRHAGLGARRRRDAGTRSPPSPASPPTARSRSWRSLGPTPPDRLSWGNASPHERELKFTPGPSFRLPAVRRPDDELRADAPDDRHVARGLLRHRRPPARTRGREPPLPQRRGLDGEAPGVGRRRARPRPRSTSDGEPGDRPTARRRPRARARTPASRSRSSRGSTPCATGSCCATTTATQLAEVVDDEVSVLDGARLVARFRELEVEFAERRAARARRAASPTACAPPAPANPQHDPEDRACARAPRARPPRSRRRRRSSTSRRLRSTCCGPPMRPLDRAPAQRTIPGCALGDDAEDVHQARVATRRLRSDLRTFRTVRRSRSGTRSLRDELKWLGGAARARCATPTCCSNGSRVALDELPTSDRDAGKRLLDGLREHRTRARDELLDAHALRALRRAARPAGRGGARRSRRRATASSSSSSSATSCGSPGRSCARRCARSATSRPTRSCTRCASAPSAPATRPRPSRPAVGQGGQAASPPRSRTPGRARRAPGRGRRRAVAPAHAADGGGRRSSPRSSPASSLRSKTSAATRSREQWPTAWKHAKRAKLRRWM